VINFSLIKQRCCPAWRPGKVTGLANQGRDPLVA